MTGLSARTLTVGVDGSEPSRQAVRWAEYGDAEPRRPRPNPNRGDNLTGGSPYQDSDPATPARYPAA